MRFANMIAFFLWCVLVFSVMCLAAGFFWLIEQFTPEDDDGN